MCSEVSKIYYTNSHTVMSFCLYSLIIYIVYNRKRGSIHLPQISLNRSSDYSRLEFQNPLAPSDDQENEDSDDDEELIKLVTDDTQS